MKLGAMLAIAGALIIAGLAVVAVGSQSVLEGIEQEAGYVGDGEQIEVSAEIAGGGSGIFAVQAAESGGVSASLIGPSGGEIMYAELDGDTLEEEFEAAGSGTYTLIVRGSGEQTQALGAIGPAPEEGSEYLGSAGLYMVAAGMALFMGLLARAYLRYYRGSV